MPEQNKSSDHRYLEQLEFKPELRKTWLNFFVVNFRVVVLLIILLTGWGIFSYLKLPRESNPEVKIPFAIITTVYPGAAPTDVEELVTKKIETGIAGVKGIKKITSSSSNSFSAVSVEFDTSQNQDDAIRSLRDKLTTIKDLPADANDPALNEVSFDDRPILSLSLTGPYDGFTLRRYADDIKDELEKLPGVREVQVSGGDEAEFSVAYDPQKLAGYGLSATTANAAVASSNLAFPGGNFEGNEFNYPVRVDNRFFDAEKLKNIPIFHAENNAIIYLKDVATVEERAIKRTAYSRFSIEGAVPQSSVNIDIIKKTGGSIIDTANQSKATVDRMLKTFAPGVRYATTTDFSKRISKDFTQLTHDFLVTLILVFGVLFLIVGMKEAIVAGLAIPLVFFATFGVMNLTGITLNFLSIFSLILALGLLVDDAIVVVSATKQYLRTGKFTPEEAVLLVLNDFKVVLTSTTLATTWAFLPLLFATGIIGSFIKSIPITVSVTLIASLLIALMINHPLAAVLERIRLTKKSFWIYFGLFSALTAFLFWQRNIYTIIIGIGFTFILYLVGKWYAVSGKQKLVENKKLMDREWQDDEAIKEKLRCQGACADEDFLSRLMHGIIHFDAIIPLYEKYLRQLVSTKKRRLTVIFATLALFIFAIILPVVGIVPTEFFPAADADNVYLTFEAPIGLKLDETNKLATQMEEKLLHYPEISNFSTVVGQPGASPSNQGGTITTSVSHLGGIVMTLVDKKDRNITSFDLAKKIRTDMSSIAGVTIKVESQGGGPPSGSAFEARIIGDDLQVLDKIAGDLRPTLASIPGVINIDTSLKPAPAEYTFMLDSAKMELYNLNAALVGGTIRMAISGTKISTVIKDTKEIDVNASFLEDKIPDLASVQNLQITNLKGQPVFLKDVAKIELKPSVGTITHIDQKKAVLLSAGVDGSTRANTVVTEFQKKVASGYKLPDGYTIVYGGENEQNAESVASIIRAMIIAMALILSTLIIQFNSFKQSMIVLVTLPLALIGVFIGMAIFQITLSFPGLIGILALFGIVVKNAIILIDKINLNIKSEIPFFESVIDAGKSRIEAIFITSICTIFGIIPITLSNETWRALGSTIVFGLILSSFLTLFIVPALYLTLVKEKERLF
ncbi:MAG: efflux RND transporter permease subunit [Candidatus Moranbacteria bacterium]|nr:efflux RND transporter permease subunit [Candidatus Moranbacteria bacterium]